jgi:hypothetical protein
MKKKVSARAGGGPRFKLTLNAAHTAYALVRKICRKEFKMKVIDDHENCEDFDLVWADRGIPNEKLARLKPH